jgi:hypothetical protein
MAKTKVELLAQTDVFGKGHEQSQPAGSGDFGATKGTEFEILDILTYHELTSWGFTCGVKPPKFFLIASILPAFWGNRGFFFYSGKKLGPVTRKFGFLRDSWTVPSTRAKIIVSIRQVLKENARSSDFME